jgi:hypothetical protein
MPLTPQITITWNSETLGGGQDAVSQLLFELANYGTNEPCVPGTCILSPITLTATAVAGAGSQVLWGNDVISPAGTYYKVTFLASNGSTIATLPYQFTGSGTFDISELTPLASTPGGPVIVGPQGPAGPGGVFGGDWINVQSPAYGAKGDGVTDDTAAIQAAFNAVNAKQNIVYFPTPSAFYKISSPITDPSSGLLQGVVGEAGGVVPGVQIQNTTGSSVFKFTHVSALGFIFGNLYWVGPGRGVASDHGVFLANVTGTAITATAVTAANGTGATVISVPNTTGISSGNVYLSGFAQAANNGFFEVVSFVANTSITIKSNMGVTDGGGSVQACSNIGEASIFNCQASGWGGSNSYALMLGAPIVSKMHNCRFHLGNKGVFINGGTSLHLSACYMLSMDKAGYETQNGSYHVFDGCATDDCGTGYLIRGGSNAIGLYTCGHEEGTAFNLTITNTQVVGGVATITYSGADQSADFYTDCSVVIAGTSNGSGELNGRQNVASMSANTIVLSGTFTNFASAADSGTAAIHAGDGYNFSGVVEVIAYNCKNTSPQQTTSSGGVLQVTTRSGFRDCNFTTGGASLETYSIYGYNNTDPVISNCSLAAAPNIGGNTALLSGDVISWNGDTGISRGSAGVIDVGNGTQGDASGTINAAQFNVGGVAPTGSGAIVLATSPTITTPVFGTPAEVRGANPFILFIGTEGGAQNCQVGEDSGFMLFSTGGSNLAMSIGPIRGVNVGNSQTDGGFGTLHADTSIDAPIHKVSGVSPTGTGALVSASAPTIASLTLTGTVTLPLPAFPLASEGITSYISITGNMAGWIEEFFSITSTTVSAAASGPTADTGWSNAPITGGTTGTIAAQSGSFQNPGQIVLTTPATSGDGIVIYKGGGSNSAGSLGILGANAGWQLDFWFELPATITNYAFRVGYCVAGQQAADPPTGGSWFEFDTANTGHDTAHIMFRTVSASTSNYDDTNAIVATASTWYHVRIFSATAGTISYQIGSANGALSAAVNITTDVDTTHACLPFIQVLPRTSTAAVLVVDRASFVANTGRV